MKLTEEQRLGLLGDVVDYAEAYEDGSWRLRSDCLDCIVVMVEKLMNDGYEAGVKQGLQNASAIASYGTAAESKLGRIGVLVSSLPSTRFAARDGKVPASVATLEAIREIFLEKP